MDSSLRKQDVVVGRRGPPSGELPRRAGEQASSGTVRERAAEAGEEDRPSKRGSQPVDRLAVKLRLLGSSAGFFLALLCIGVAALLVLDLQPLEGHLLAWVTPMGIAMVVLAGAWLTRRSQYEHPNLIWYFSLAVAVLAAGVGWAAFLDRILTVAEPARQSAGLLVVSVEVLMGTLMFTVDVLMAGLYVLGLAAATLGHLLLSGRHVHTDLLLLLAASAVTVPLLALWGYRQQRRLIHAVAELKVLRPSFEALEYDAEQLRRDLQGQTQSRRSVEQELARAKDAAESAAIAKTEFLATMSHEIRTPLNGIVPILEILRDTRLDEEQAEFVTTALNSSHHLLNLINDILDYSKIEAGKLELETIEVNVPDLIESVIALMTKAAERRGIRLTGKIARNVPRQVRGDPFRLRQILTNLVGNAIKFTERGSVSVEVNRHASSQREVVLLFAVRDTGIGMSSETVERLFKVFAQADASTTRKYGGTGLGLVICKRLVELMGGRIGVKSEEGRGSVFWFVAPMRKALHEVPSARQSLQGVRVLLAGFDELELQRLVNYLSEWGMLNERAGTPSEVLTKLRASAKLGVSWSYDVLIIDAQSMSSAVSGMVRDVRKVFELSTLTVVAVDAFPSMAALLKEWGISEVIPRPVQEQELRSRLHRLLDVQTYKARGPGAGEERRWVLPDGALGWDAGRTDTHPAADAVPERSLSEETPLEGKVLVVEDNPVNLSVVRKLLQRFGLDCDVARDGSEALAAVRKVQYDLVFMDVQMPVMDGYQATQAMRRREAERGLAHMPIVAMTANAMAGDREKCLDAGMDDYLSKPIKPADLKAMLRNWLPMRSEEHTAPAPEPPRIALPSETPSVAVVEAPVEAGGVLDRDVLGELFDIMEDEACELLQEYLDNAPGLLRRVDQAVQAGNAEDLVLPAHSLKSSSANVGAMRVSELAKQLEFMGREGNMCEAGGAWAGMQRAYAAAERDLKAIIARGRL